MSIITTDRKTTIVDGGRDAVGVRIMHVISPDTYAKLFEYCEKLNAYHRDPVIKSILTLKTRVPEILTDTNVNDDEKRNDYLHLLRDLILTVHETYKSAFDNLNGNNNSTSTTTTTSMSGTAAAPAREQFSLPKPLISMDNSGAVGPFSYCHSAATSASAGRSLSPRRVNLLQQFNEKRIRKVQQILQAFDHSRRISFDKNSYGVYIDNQMVPGSNIVDVVQDMLNTSTVLNAKKKRQVAIPGMDRIIRQLAVHSNLGVNAILNPALKNKFIKFRGGGGGGSADRIASNHVAPDHYCNYNYDSGGNDYEEPTSTVMMMNSTNGNRGADDCSFFFNNTNDHHIRPMKKKYTTNSDGDNRDEYWIKTPNL